MNETEIEEEPFLKCLNVSRRAIPLLEMFKPAQVVSQWFMSRMLENQLGIKSKYEDAKSDLAEFMEWQDHVNKLRQEAIALLTNPISSKAKIF